MFFPLPNKTFLPKKVSLTNQVVAPTAVRPVNKGMAAVIPERVSVPNLEKCMTPLARLVANPLRFLFDPAVTGLYTAVTVTPGKVVVIN